MKGARKQGNVLSMSPIDHSTDISTRALEDRIRERAYDQENMVHDYSDDGC